MRQNSCIVEATNSLIVMFSSGGTRVTITGIRLNIVQEPQFYLSRESSSKRQRRDTSNDYVYGSCSNITSTKMICNVPAIHPSWLVNLRNLSDLQLNYGVIMDGIQVRWIIYFSLFYIFIS